MPECSFCHVTYEFPRGTTLVLKDGSVKYLCSGKCMKNFRMGRDNKKLQWIRKMPSAEEKPAEPVEAKKE